MPDRQTNPPSTTPLDAQLRKWLETSGRALELRVGRVFAQAGAIVQPSVAFTDVVSDQQRETDVVAEFGWTQHLVNTPPLPCSLTAVVECKSGRGDPWVAFGGGSGRARLDTLDDWFAFGHAPYTPVTDQVTSLWPGSPPFTGSAPATHIVSAKLGSGSPPASGTQNVAGNAIRQVLAAADGLRTNYLQRQGLEQKGLFLVPILVIGAPLFYCELDTANELTLQPVASVDVWGYCADGRRVRVYVMQESSLPAFAADLRDRAAQASQ